MATNFISISSFGKTVREVQKTVREVQKTVREVQKTVREVHVPAPFLPILIIVISNAFPFAQARF
jgi:hypothetical protein